MLAWSIWQSKTGEFWLQVSAPWDWLAQPATSFMTWSDCEWMHGSIHGSIQAGDLSRLCNRCWLWQTVVCLGVALAWAALDWYRLPIRISYFQPLLRRQVCWVDW